jgi:hypothetical protein
LRGFFYAVRVTARRSPPCRQPAGQFPLTQGNSVSIQSASGAIDIQAMGQLTIKAAAIKLEAAGPVKLKAGATNHSR